jgi:hypothetical protein
VGAPGHRRYCLDFGQRQGLDDAAWLVNLPADELRACRQLWADVDALLQRAGSPK